MKTKKNFADVLGLMAASTSGAGMIVMLVPMVINLFFFNYSNQILDSIAVFGALAFMLPLFLLQFAMPSGLLERFGFQWEIPFWGKVMFYLFVFPFANVWMLATAEAMFHFLPNYRAAMMQGFSKEIVQAMHHESTVQAWTIIGITYSSLLFLGLITRGISNKLKLA